MPITQMDKMFGGEYDITAPVECWSCHQDDKGGNPEKVNMTTKYVLDGLGSDSNSVPMESVVCMQCHVEYYFKVILQKSKMA